MKKSAIQANSDSSEAKSGAIQLQTPNATTNTNTNTNTNRSQEVPSIPPKKESQIALLVTGKTIVNTVDPKVSHKSLKLIVGGSNFALFLMYLLFKSVVMHLIHEAMRNECYPRAEPVADGKHVCSGETYLDWKREQTPQIALIVFGISFYLHVIGLAFGAFGSWSSHVSHLAVYIIIFILSTLFMIVCLIMAQIVTSISKDESLFRYLGIEWWHLLLIVCLVIVELIIFIFAIILFINAYTTRELSKKRNHIKN